MNTISRPLRLSGRLPLQLHPRAIQPQPFRSRIQSGTPRTLHGHADPSVRQTTFKHPPPTSCRSSLTQHQPTRSPFQRPTHRPQHNSYSTTPKRESRHPQSQNPTNTTIPQPPLSTSQRFRKLSREYGWSAMGVYLALSALDFPFCFAAVRWLGPERVGKAEEAVVDGIGKRIPEPVKEAWAALKGKVVGWRASIAGVTQGDPGKDGEVEGFDGGIVHAEARSKGANASIWTQLALAYAIHKSFIFIRLPITVAILPKVVKTLRGWGWQIGKRKVKAPPPSM